MRLPPSKRGRWRAIVPFCGIKFVKCHYGGDSTHPPLLAVIYAGDTVQPNYLFLLTVKGMVTSCVTDFLGQLGHLLSTEYINGLNHVTSASGVTNCSSG
jgi:hypothetical protein